MFAFSFDTEHQQQQPKAAAALPEKIVNNSSDLQIMTGNNVSCSSLNDNLDNDNDMEENVECYETFDCNDLYDEYRNECQKWLNIDDYDNDFDSKVFLFQYFDNFILKLII